MDRFEYDAQQLRFRLTDYECEMVSSLITQLGVLVSGVGQTPEVSDQFARWQAEISGLSPLDFSDPAIARLFPSAYSDDLVASDEFLRLTETQRRLTLINAVSTVRKDLEKADLLGKASRQVTIATDNVDIWLQAVNALRITLSVRLEIVTYEDIEALESGRANEQLGYLYQIYEWLGYLIEGLVSSP